MRQNAGAAARGAGTVEPILSVSAVEFAYGRVPVLFGIDLALAPGEILGLLGTNGAGKSTILRILAGLESPSRGRVHFDGADVTGMGAEDLCRRGLVMVAGGKAVFPDLTVWENLELGGYTLPARLLAERAERELGRFPGLAARRGLAAGALSGGEQQQLAIAKALLLDPRVLFIDELSLGLAPRIVGELFDVVTDINHDGVSMILVEQSLTVAAGLCDRAVFLEKGTVRFEGRVADLIERGDLARAVFLGGRPETVLAGDGRV